jgi:hypothetical protein
MKKVLACFVFLGLLIGAPLTYAQSITLGISEGRPRPFGSDPPLLSLESIPHQYTVKLRVYASDLKAYQEIMQKMQKLLLSIKQHKVYYIRYVKGFILPMLSEVRNMWHGSQHYVDCGIHHALPFLFFESPKGIL